MIRRQNQRRLVCGCCLLDCLHQRINRRVGKGKIVDIASPHAQSSRLSVVNSRRMRDRKVQKYESNRFILNDGLRRLCQLFVVARMSHLFSGDASYCFFHVFPGRATAHISALI